MFSSPVLRGGYRIGEILQDDFAEIMFSSPVLRGGYRILDRYTDDFWQQAQFSSPLLRGGCRLDSFLKPITPVVQR